MSISPALKRSLTIAIFWAMYAFAVRAQNTNEPLLKDKYHSLEVEAFHAEEGSDFPSKQVIPLEDEIVKQFQASKKVQDVHRAGEKAANPDTPVLRLDGTITRFRSGNQAERYFVGFGAGSTEIYVHVSLVDTSTGRTMATEELRGIIASGFLGGQSSEILHDFARRVVTATQIMMEKRLAVAEKTAASGEAESVSYEQNALPLDAGNLDAAQKQLNALAAIGYRVTGARVSGKRKAKLLLEKSASPPDVYEYRLFHVLWDPKIKKDLDASGANGFHLLGTTLMSNFGGIVSWVMEKPPGPQKSVYTYHVHETFRVSTAEHNIDGDRKDGYDLAGTAEMTGGHITVTEKVVGIQSNAEVSK